MMGWMLARILLGFSKGQRHKIAQKCFDRQPPLFQPGVPYRLFRHVSLNQDAIENLDAIEPFRPGGQIE